MSDFTSLRVCPCFDREASTWYPVQPDKNTNDLPMVNGFSIGFGSVGADVPESTIANDLVDEIVGSVIGPVHWTDSERTVGHPNHRHRSRRRRVLGVVVNGFSIDLSRGRYLLLLHRCHLYQDCSSCGCYRLRHS